MMQQIENGSKLSSIAKGKGAGFDSVPFCSSRKA